MRILTLIFFCFIYVNSSSQQVDPILQGIAPSNYIQHKVLPKESWFSVARLYNVNARELATFNKIALEKGLAIGQEIKIPITSSNKYDDKVNLANGEVTVPVYYIVQKSEGLYRIAINAGVTMQQLRNWNGLTNDNLATGSRLKVGFIKVKEMESSLATKKEVPIKGEPSISSETKEVPKKDDAIATKSDIAKVPPTVEAPIVKKEDKPNVKPIVVKEPPTPKPSKNNNESFFKNEYLSQNLANHNELSGKSATFKTMAGWDDNKFYALMDGINPGSIIKITNKANGKFIFAKVLGEMQELKQNHGLLVRISNASANALDANEEVFEVEIKY